MSSDVSFTPSTNFFNPVGTGFLSFMAINNSLTRMVIPTDGYDRTLGQIYYYTRASSSDAWSNKIQIQGIPVSSMRWMSAAMSENGDRLVVISYSSQPYVFKWINGTYVFQGTIPKPSTMVSYYSGLNMTADGSRIVLSAVGGYVYYATLNTATNNYNEPIQILDTELRTNVNNQFGNLAMSSNGNRIAAMYNISNGTSKFLFSDWNGTNYGPFTQITALNGQLEFCGGGALSADGKYLFINKPQPSYSYFDAIAGNFTSFTNVPSSAIPSLNGIYYVNIFTITHDGSHLFWNVNRDDITIKMTAIEYPPPPPPSFVFLGENAVIHRSDVSFNDANVFVKAPTVALNVSNKQYVDVADEEVRALILASATTDTTSTTEYYDLLGQRQTVQTTLAVQIDQLYQYFFNQSRANATLFYSTLTSPLALDGCSLWLDSADSISVIRSGTSVSAWNDKSSRGYTFTQTNSAKRPSYIANALDGKSTISFANETSHQYLAGASGLGLGNNSFSMFIVCTFEGFNTVMLSKFRTNGEVDNGDIRFFSYGDFKQVWANHNFTGFAESPVPLTISGYNIVELIVNRVEGKDSIYYNGDTPPHRNYTWTSYVKTYAPDISYNVPTNPYNMILGGFNVNGTPPESQSGFFNGQIAEVVTYLNPYDLTDSKRYQIEGYLAHKWGLESKLPNNHPFKTSTSIRL